MASDNQKDTGLMMTLRPNKYADKPIFLIGSFGEVLAHSQTEADTMILAAWGA